MSNETQKQTRPWQVLFSSWFGTGYAPLASGTVGAFFTLPLCWVVTLLPAWWWFGFVVLLTLFAFYVSQVAGKYHGEHDSGIIVIDESVGMLITLAFQPANLAIFAVGFVLFRIADVIKPWPANWFDKKVENGIGVVMDDVVAGIYAAAALWLLRTFTHFETWAVFEDLTPF